MSESRSYKLALTGHSETGKTCLFNKLINPKSEHVKQYDGTIGAGFGVYKHPNNPDISFDVWDTSGNPRYTSLQHFYFKNRNLVLMVINSQSSGEQFDAELKYLCEIATLINRDEIECMLVFTKHDTENIASLNDRIAIAKETLKVSEHIVCSAKTGLNIDELRLNILNKATANFTATSKNKSDPIKPAPTEEKKGFWDNQIAASTFWSKHKTAFKVLSVATFGVFLGLYKVSQCLSCCTSSNTPAPKITTSTKNLPFPQNLTMYSQSGGDEDIMMEMGSDGQTLKKPLVLPLTQQHRNNLPTQQRRAKL